MDTIEKLEIDQEDILKAVRESAMLADVSISVWGGTRTDNNLLNEMKARHGAVGDVGRVIKNLMSGADLPLKTTRSAYMAVRTKHYSLTLPWVSDPTAIRQEGPRLLPHMINDRYMTEMSMLRRAAIAARDEFLDAYPGLVKEAKSNLGTMADDKQYPSVDELRGSFRVHFDFEPLPEGASFRGLSPHTIERLTKGLLSKQQRQLQEAQRMIWERAKKPIEHLVERLTNVEENSRFKDATIENVRELMTLLPGWNVTKDARVQEITRDIESMLANVTPSEIRKNKNIRGDVVKEAKNVVNKLSSWGF